MDNDYTDPHKILSPPGITNLILGVGIFSVFVCIFYFTYASVVEKNIVIKEIDYLVDDMTENFTNIGIKLPLKPLKAPDMSDADKSVQDTNNKLIKQATQAIGILAGVCVFISILLYYFYRFNIKDILIGNFILLLFIALTEFYYSTFIAANYDSVDKNVIKLHILENLRKI